MIARTATIGVAVLTVALFRHGSVWSDPPEKKKDPPAPKAQKNDPEQLIRQKFPVLKGENIPPLVRLEDDALAKSLPSHQCFVLRFRQFPVSVAPPAPLQANNLFIVSKDGKVLHFVDVAGEITKDVQKGLIPFFKVNLSPAKNEEAVKNALRTWLRLSQEFKQDGMFRFTIPEESLKVSPDADGKKAVGKAVVTPQGGNQGAIEVEILFDKEGRPTRVNETNSVQAGMRPICQATKLLDPDPIVRRMAEQDLLIMGSAAKAYLDEQRAKAGPELQKEIDRVWQRILAEKR